MLHWDEQIATFVCSDLFSLKTILTNQFALFLEGGRKHRKSAQQQASECLRLQCFACHAQGWLDALKWFTLLFDLLNVKLKIQVNNYCFKGENIMTAGSRVTALVVGPLQRFRALMFYFKADTRSFFQNLIRFFFYFILSKIQRSWLRSPNSSFNRAGPSVDLIYFRIFRVWFSMLCKNI